MQTAIYLHIPFCVRRCAYCDFNTYAGLLHLREAYVQALLQEIDRWAARAPHVQARTLYFGGGTPSLLPAEDVAALIRAVRQAFSLPETAEITLEANPGTLTYDGLLALRAAGVNRLSLGAQSADPQELALLGRIHLWPSVEEAVRLARAAGFANISLDLMMGLPTQALPGWLKTLDRALALEPDHLSLYMLSLEEGTPLHAAVARGAYPCPDADLAADMYLAASESLRAAGFWQYEISNWARGLTQAPAVWALPPGGATEGIGPAVCAHNLIYWRNTPWLGFGAGAHSWWEGLRWGNLLAPDAYIRALHGDQPVVAEEEAIDRATEAGETMMMGLRLAEGVTTARWRARFGVDLAATYAAVLPRLLQLGLLETDDARIRLSAAGRLLGNQVFQAFLP